MASKNRLLLGQAPSRAILLKPAGCRSLRGLVLGVCVRGTVDCLSKMFRCLRALHGNAAAEDGARHAIDACLLGGIGLGLRPLDILFAGEAAAHELGIKSAAGRGLNQDSSVGKIAALRKIKLH